MEDLGGRRGGGNENGWFCRKISSLLVDETKSYKNVIVYI